MKTASESLPDDIEQLKKLLLAERDLSHQKDTRIDHLTEQNQQLLEQFRLAQQHAFGKSSESHPDQLGLFNEAEAEMDVAVSDNPEASISKSKTTRHTHNKPVRKPLPKHLPREQIIHDLDEADKVCDCCGHDLHRMGEKTREQLEFIPAQLKVIEHIRPQYSCRHCEQKGTESTIKIAAVPMTPIAKSIATPSLLSQIISSKYQYALPLYRQESLFRQYGIDLNRKTMANWMIKCSEVFTPFYQHLKMLQQNQPVIHADETPLKVIHEDKNQCYMWVYCSGTDSPDAIPEIDRADSNATPYNIVLYDYQNSRSGQCPKNYLQHFDGYLQVDGYAGYDQTDATLVGCFAHARRKFIDAKKTQAKGKTGKADWALNHIQKLYRIEKQIKGQTPEQKTIIRQKQAIPLLKQLKNWLDKSALQVLLPTMQN